MSIQAGRGRKLRDARSPSSSSSFATATPAPAPGFFKTKRITLLVFGRPVGKARARRGRGGHFYTPDRTRKYEQLVQREFRRRYPDHLPWTGPISILVVAHVRTPTAKPDGSNILKLIEDALNGLAYRDDAQITDARVVKAKTVVATTGDYWATIHVKEIQP